MSQTEYDGTIPGEVVIERGVEYYVRLSDGSTTVTAPAANPTAQPRFTEIQVPSIEAEIELEANQYRMISVPLRLEETDAFSQLQDDFGGLDRTSWSLLRWDPETESYDEVTTEDGTGDLMPGKAYWLITDAGEDQDGWPTFDVQDGRSPSPETVQIELPPGWTQLANPWPYALGLTARLEREGKASLRDDHTVMGVADAGQPGVGLEDVAEPPPIGDHLLLSIVEGKTRLAGSLRPAGKEGYRWDLEVSASARSGDRGWSMESWRPTGRFRRASSIDLWTERPAG